MAFTRARMFMKNGGLERALILLDLEVPGYYVDKEAGQDQRRILALHNPDLIMIIYGDSPNKNDEGFHFSLESPEEYDASFREWANNEGNAVLKPNFLREEGKLYRKLMSIYPGVEMLLENELERIIKDKKEKSRIDFEKRFGRHS
jgi:hypothetical protein